VRRLFSFDFSSSTPKIVLTGFDGKTTYDASGYTLNIAYEKSYDSTSFADPDTADSPMSDYLTIADGSFEIHDGTGLLGVVNYTTGQSLNDVATTIEAIAGVNATVVSASGAFHIEIKSDTNDALTFQSDTGGLVAELDIQNRGDAIYSANIGGSADGADDGSVTVNGNSLAATSTTGAEGLQLFYNGNGDMSGITLDYTVGLGATLYFTLDDMMTTDGLLDSEIDLLTEQNEVAEDRITDMETRIEIQRQTLLAKFIAMEVALATSQRILDSIKQTTDAMFAQNS
jgi:hypothetical protein